MKRIGNSFKGIFGGFIAILIGIVLLWWNEGNNVKNLKTTAEMDKSYIDVSSESIDSSNEGKLIATSGKLINEQELTDSMFDVTIKTPIMKRVVEIYQWVEESDTDEDGNTTYSYKKEWSSDIINSNNFHQTGHTNPQQKLYEDDEYTSNEVRVGAFVLTNDQVRSLSTNGTFTSFNQEKVTELNLTIYGNYLTNSSNLSNPEVGDMRISFVYNNSSDISVLAVQSGNTFTNFVSKAGKTINRVMDGIHNGKDMINTIKHENKVLKWILRAVGILACVIGFATILKPISAITSYVPLLGGLVGSAVGLVSFILGLCLGLIIIALSWVVYRPLLGIGLLIVVAALIVFLIKRGKKSKVENNVQSNTQPPMNNQNNVQMSNQINGQSPVINQSNVQPPINNQSNIQMPINNQSNIQMPINDQNSNQDINQNN